LIRVVEQECDGWSGLFVRGNRKMTPTVQSG
jgi:hypothetical protein